MTEQKAAFGGAAAGRGPAGRGPRIGLAKKMLLGFGALTALVFALAVANLAILQRSTRVNASILEAEVPLLDVTTRMLEEVLEQEFYARRSATSQSEEMMQVSREEGEEFRDLLAAAGSFHQSSRLPLRRIGELHAAYSALLEPAPGGQGDSEERLREVQRELVGLIKGVALEARRDQQRKIEQINRMGERAFRIMATACASALLLSAAATFLLTRSIARPIGRLKAATERIAAGHFDIVPDVRRGDELGDLSRAFAVMAGRLEQLEERSLDANPLTRLPGNLAIESEVRARLERNAPFVFCLADLDNFKAYNDHYGYARGSELIKATARVVEQAVAEHGGPGDFTGHIGGDDFVVVTTPERFRGICQGIIEDFDAMAGAHYDPPDLRRGHLVTKNRQGLEERFPIITISIAAVTSCEHEITNPIQIGEIAADLKEYAKSLEGSVYVVDHHRKEAVHGRRR